MFCFKLIIRAAEECVSSRGLCVCQEQGQHSGEDGAWHQVGLGSCHTMLGTFGPCCATFA